MGRNWDAAAPGNTPGMQPKVGGEHMRDDEIHMVYKARMKRKVFLSLILIALFFAFTLLPPQVLLLLTETSNSWVVLATKAVGSISIATLASGILFASDSAFKGSNKTASWVMATYPSNAAEKRVKCSQREAATLWFKFFDTWGLPASPHHSLVASTYSATYQGRWMYYLTWTLGIFSVLGVGAIIVNHFVFDVYAGSQARIVLHATILAAYAVAFLAVWRTNRIGSKGRRPTGCWERVEQVLQQSTVLFERDVLSNAISLEDAFDTVANIRETLAAEAHEDAQVDAIMAEALL